jgi:hypothetical protein
VAFVHAFGWGCRWRGVNGTGRQAAKLEEALERVELGAFSGWNSYCRSASKRHQHQIRLISLAGQPARKITVKDWNNIVSLDWAADGKRFSISSNLTVRLDTALLWIVEHF